LIDLVLMCLAQNVYWEARDQSIAGQVAVAQVTMNRVASPDYPNDVCSVVHQHKQFSWYWDGKSDVPREAASWNRAQMVAMGVLAGSGHGELTNPNITHYHAVYSKPYWAPTMKLVAQIGDHIFYTPHGG
jgi:N-acetylmuramoyl-L-alanine amidase